MSLEAYVGKSFEIVYDTDGTQSGLTDLTVIWYDNLGAHNPATDFVVLSEIGTSGIYKGLFTPTAEGTWVLVAGSVTSNPIIEDKALNLKVKKYDEDDTAGFGFVSNTDSLSAISSKVDAVLSAQGAPSARGGLI